MTAADWFIVSTIFVAVGLNVWWFFDGLEGTTISAQVVAASAFSVLPPAAYGVIGGHWFIPTKWEAPGGFWIMLSLAAGIVAVELLTQGALARHSHPIQWLLGWMALAPTLWPMGDTPA